MDHEAFTKLSKDLINAAATLGNREARFLVDNYYLLQDNRIRAGLQIHHMPDEPHGVLEWMEENAKAMELQIKSALHKYARGHHMGQWALNIIGIGPVLAAGFLSHIDLSTTDKNGRSIDTASQVWSFCGLNPNAVWKKGQKRPWNATLKVICWKAGESFVKVSGNPKSQYGKLYAERKEKEILGNEQGAFAELAAQRVKTVGKSTEAYKAYSQGKLPPAHLHARAKRYAVKLFLAHYFEEAYRHLHGKEPPAPYPIAHLGHAHIIKPHDGE